MFLPRTFLNWNSDRWILHIRPAATKQQKEKKNSEMNLQLLVVKISRALAHVEMTDRGGDHHFHTSHSSSITRSPHLVHKHREP